MDATRPNRPPRDTQKGFAVLAAAGLFVAGAVIFTFSQIADIDQTDASRYEQTRHDMRILRVAVEAALVLGTTTVAELQDSLNNEDLGLPARLIRDSWGNPITYDNDLSAYTPWIQNNCEFVLIASRPAPQQNIVLCGGTGP